MTIDPAEPADQVPQADPSPRAENSNEPGEQPAAGTVIHLMAGGDSCRPGQLCT
jgi:hypothetical protein